MSKKKEDVIIKPRTDNQYNAIRSSADFVVLTGNTGSAKSFSLYYAPSTYLATEPNSKDYLFHA